MRNRNAWRWSLDPRDPEYDPPPEHEQEEPAPELEALDDDPRCDGPYHYIPPGER